MDSPGDDLLQRTAARVAERLLADGLMLTAAESCTGGWVAKVCTDLAGSSAWFERGFVTYTNEAKQELLDVSAGTLADHGAVSEQTVAEMAIGALTHSRADISLSISGIAGPGGATPDKPLGTVCFGWKRLDRPARTERRRFEGGREQVRRQAVLHALEGILEVLDG